MRVALGFAGKGRTIGATIVFLGASSIVATQAQQRVAKTVPASASANAEIDATLWQKILTTCEVNIKGQTKTVRFFQLPERGSMNPARLEKYLGARTKFDPEKVTEADQLNGIQARGLAWLTGSSYQFMTTSGWSPWKDLSHMTMSTMHEAFGLDGGVAISAERRNDRWSFSMYGDKARLDVSKMEAGKKLCAELTK